MKSKKTTKKRQANAGGRMFTLLMMKTLFLREIRITLSTEVNILYPKKLLYNDKKVY
jgi:hypothetical protein